MPSVLSETNRRLSICAPKGYEKSKTILPFEGFSRISLQALEGLQSLDAIISFDFGEFMEHEDAPEFLGVDHHCLIPKLHPEGLLLNFTVQAETDVRHESDRLNSTGLSLTAIFEFEQNWFGQKWGMVGLCYQKSARRSKVPCYRIPTDLSEQARLLNDFRKNKADFFLNLDGPGNYINIQTRHAKAKLKRLAERAGILSIEARSIFKSVDDTEVGNCEGTEAIFISLNGPENHGTFRDGAGFVCHVNTDVAYPEYLSKLIEGPLGPLIRQSISRLREGWEIDHVLLLTARFPLPTIEKQKEIVQVLLLKETAIKSLHEAAFNVWTEPESVGELENSLVSVLPENDLVAWCETLPWPLARVLRPALVQETLSDAQKHLRLCKFFETFAGLLAIMQLSLLRHTMPAWQQALDAVRSPRGNIMKEASFGTWVKLHRQTAKVLANVAKSLATATKVDSDAKRVQAQVPDFLEETNIWLDVLKPFSSTGLRSLLAKSALIRNDQTVAHGGLEISEAKAHDKFQALFSEVQKLRNEIGMGFKSLRLCRIGSGKISRSGFICEAEILHGSNLPFSSERICLSPPPVSGEIYLQKSGTDAALQLLPLLRIIPSPENFCYLYGREARDGHLFVSHHHGDAPEKVFGADEFHGLSQLLAELNATG